MDDTTARVLQLIRDELEVDAGALSLDAPLTELGDSLAWVSLLCAVESTFNVRIDAEQGLTLRTARDLVHLLQESRSAIA